MDDIHDSHSRSSNGTETQDAKRRKCVCDLRVTYCHNRLKSSLDPIAQERAVVVVFETRKTKSQCLQLTRIRTEELEEVDLATLLLGLASLQVPANSTISRMQTTTYTTPRLMTDIWRTVTIHRKYWNRKV